MQKIPCSMVQWQKTQSMTWKRSPLASAGSSWDDSEKSKDPSVAALFCEVVEVLAFVYWCSKWALQSKCGSSWWKVRRNAILARNMNNTAEDMKPPSSACQIKKIWCGVLDSKADILVPRKPSNLFLISIVMNETSSSIILWSRHSMVGNCSCGLRFWTKVGGNPFLIFCRFFFLATFSHRFFRFY